MTDAHDRHTLTTILQTFYNPHVLERGHKLSPSGVYLSPDLETPKEFLDHISALPLLASPEVHSAGSARLQAAMQKCRRGHKLECRGSVAVSWRPFLVSAPVYPSCSGDVWGIPDVCGSCGAQPRRPVKVCPLSSPEEAPHLQVFGLHENADITKDLKETNQLLESVLLTQSRDASGGGLQAAAGCLRAQLPCACALLQALLAAMSCLPVHRVFDVSAGSGKSSESILAEVAADILARLPPDFDVEAVSVKYPASYQDSMNTVSKWQRAACRPSTCL